ncbi:hypothetical protein GCM10010124_15750 [Pilimelia terevasa]|uniref:Actinobacteria/chloroflexi VLRF1 release factor domain-containing protein n=1 Tax=Pilimelia terevasa TaxID=53372 RepID=A0A8J3BNF1_9ACTN|nr:acVLRF1 family peptidyl-tRNA hydrolase [Pilimelia terevasa]GGK24084.1 hypothetical protein GCM10010124_15750 [Pilimelia terevasa]
MQGRPAAGGGRWIEVPQARLARWVAGFDARHGAPTVHAEPYGARLVAPDGAEAEIHLPPGAPAPGPPGAAAGSVVDRVAAAAAAPRALGLVLARRGAVAVAVADGDTLTRTKVDTRYVQGRTAAGGWSQQRFARRRENQARAAAQAGADIVARLLLPEVGRLAAVVCGGDRQFVEAVMADRRLAPLAPLRAARLYEVPEPRHAVLESTLAAARALRVLVREPGPR